MVTDKISLEKIFSECNNHLRETDNKRDQLISFYLVLVGAFLALNNAQPPTSLNSNFGILPALVLSLVGLLVIAATNEYRKWHGRYSRTATLLIALGRDDERSFEKIEKDARKKVYSDTGQANNTPMSPLKWLSKRYLWGTEFYTYQASIIISSIPIYLLFKSPIDLVIQVAQSRIGSAPILTVSLLFIIYLLVFNLCAAWNLYHDFRQYPWAKWLVRGLKKDVDFEYNS